MTGAPLVHLGIRVRREQAEIALANLLPTLQHGAEETEVDDDAVEYAVYAPRAELPKESTLRELAGNALLELTLTDVPPGWERRWQQYLRPVEVEAAGRRLRIRPPWQEPGEDGTPELVVDPGHSFGAGTHATTQVCLEELLALEDPGGPLCDWGAGSGVLSVVAARLGFEPVVAVEVDPGSLETIRANAAANGVVVRTKWLNLGATEPPWAPTVVANLYRDLLLDVAPTLERPPDRLIASGFLAGQEEEIAEAFAPLGLREAGRRTKGDWAALRLESA